MISPHSMRADGTPRIAGVPSTAVYTKSPGRHRSRSTHARGIRLADRQAVPLPIHELRHYTAEEVSGVRSKRLSRAVLEQDRDRTVGRDPHRLPVTLQPCHALHNPNRSARRDPRLHPEAFEILREIALLVVVVSPSSLQPPRWCQISDAARTILGLGRHQHDILPDTFVRVVACGLIAMHTAS